MGKGKLDNICSPSSWRQKPAAQLPHYPCSKSLRKIEHYLQRAPALVEVSAIENLRQDLSRAQRGEAFILQAGYCAESFNDRKPSDLARLIALINDMAAILHKASQKPIIKIGRLAGQLAKPRSAAYEIKNNKTLPIYRGDLINSPLDDEKARIPDPKRMLSGYQHSYIILKQLAQLLKGEGGHANAFYTSHEALLLYYEEALTRYCQAEQKFYDRSAHMLWIGDRTRQIDHAHVEFCRSIANPIGLKCGPSITAPILLALLDKLNCQKQEGRIILITRFGYDKIDKLLPPLVLAVQESGHKPLWCCDPMHGNTSYYEGYKTRSFEHILQEIASFMTILYSLNSIPAGLHLEVSGREVTECFGHNVKPSELKTCYESLCDPRLNPKQALELARFSGQMLKDNNRSNLKCLIGS